MESATQFNHDALKHDALNSGALQVICEMLPAAVLVTNDEGKSLFQNQAVSDVLGEGEANFSLSLGWYLPDGTTVLSPEESPVVRALRGEEIRDELFCRKNRQHLPGVWIRVTGSAIRNAAGRITSAVLLLRDVSQGRLSQQTSGLLSKVIEQFADGILLTNRQGFVEYANPAFETMTGLSAEHLRGKEPHLPQAGHRGSALYQPSWDELVGEHPFQTIVTNRKKTGETYHLEETIIPIADETGTTSHFVTVIKDITAALTTQEREIQLRLARQIQQKFYRVAPAVPGFDVAAGAYPAYETSGDYFDFILLPNDRLAIAVGDVEGHGFGSALVMALTRAYVHSFAALGLELDQILSQVNRMLIDDLGDGCFVTLMLASLDVRSRSLISAGAGHIPGYVLNPSGTTEYTLESSGPPLGLFPNATFSRNPPITLEPGQLLVLLTDGITESASPDGTEWGAKGALDYLVSHRDQSAAHLVEGLFHQAMRFACKEPQRDDITSVVIKVESDICK